MVCGEYIILDKTIQEAMEWKVSVVVPESPPQN